MSSAVFTPAQTITFQVQIFATEINSPANGYKYMGNGMHKKLNELLIEKDKTRISVLARSLNFYNSVK